MIDILRIKAQSYGLDPFLVQAIATVESNLKEWKARLEPNFFYYENPAKYSVLLGITIITEKAFQQTSWGPMQIMGAVARERGFEGDLPRLAQAELGIQYGCMQLAYLKKSFVNELDLISAYNAGSPSKIGTKYRNQNYVDKVSDILTKLRKSQKVLA